MDCKSPLCVYNQNKKKCVKPNPYIQWLSKCGKTTNSITKCRELYKKSVAKHRKNACDYYKENSKAIVSTCPKKRKPIKNKCPPDFPLKKLNKNNDICCFKKPVEKPSRKSSEKPVEKSSKKSVEKPINSLDKYKPMYDRTGANFLKFDLGNKEQIPKIIYKYQNKPKPRKVS